MIINLNSIGKYVKVLPVTSNMWICIARSE